MPNDIAPDELVQKAFMLRQDRALIGATELGICGVVQRVKPGLDSRAALYRYVCPEPFVISLLKGNPSAHRHYS